MYKNICRNRASIFRISIISHFHAMSKFIIVSKRKWKHCNTYAKLYESIPFSLSYRRIVTSGCCWGAAAITATKHANITIWKKMINQIIILKIIIFKSFKGYRYDIKRVRFFTDFIVGFFYCSRKRRFQVVGSNWTDEKLLVS